MNLQPLSMDCSPELRPKSVHWWRRTWPQQCVWQPESNCGLLIPLEVDLVALTRGKEIGEGGRGKGRNQGDKGPNNRARSRWLKPMLLLSKGERRRARTNRSHNSRRTSRAKDEVEDDLHVPCAAVRIICYGTALTRNWHGRHCKRPRNRETNFLDPYAHKLWRLGGAARFSQREYRGEGPEARKGKKKGTYFICSGRKEKGSSYSLN